MPSPLTDLRPASDRHDAVLALVLGAFSFSRRIEAALLRPSSGNGRPMDPQHPLVLAALGIVSVSRTLDRWMEEASIPPEPTEARMLVPLPDSRDLMR